MMRKLRITMIVGLIVALVGFGLNQVVKYANDGLFPVDAPQSQVGGVESGYVPIDQNTKLVALSDVIPLGSNRASLGDLVLWIGMAAACGSAVSLFVRRALEMQHEADV